MQWVYALFLRVLPSDFRAAFGGAMVTDFARRLRAAGARGLHAAAWLTLREVLSILQCAAGEWVAKASASPFQRDMIFRDHSRMRPPGASKSFWYGL
jgi:hypothetical protein